MTGAEIKAWRLKREIGAREWWKMLQEAFCWPLHYGSWVETETWDESWGPKPHQSLYPVCVFQYRVETLIRGYEACEKRKESANDRRQTHGRVEEDAKIIYHTNREL